MMKNIVRRLIIFTLFVFVVTTPISAQEIMDERTYNDFVRLRYENSLGNRVLTETNIKGSPYLNQEFTIGSLLTYDNILYKDVPLRYNIFNDAIEYATGEETCLAISNPEKMKEIKIGTTRFIYTNKKDKKGDQFGYYELLNDGNIQLLKQYNLIFVEKTDPAPYKPAEHAKFKRISDSYYFKLGHAEPQQIFRKKDIETIFGEKSKLILDFVKKQKIKINEETDLIKLAKYINTL